MLTKSKTSGLILALFFLASFVATYLAVYFPRPFPALSGWMIAFLIIANVLVIFLISRSGIVMGLEEEVGFGLRGLAGWVTSGVIAGFLTAVLNYYLLPLLGERVLRPVAQMAGSGVILYTAYWVAFRRNIFNTAIVNSPIFLRTRRAESLFLILGGLLLTIGGMTWAFNVVGGESKSFWFAAGMTSMGLSALLLGALNREIRRDGFANRLIWVEFVLFGVSLVFLAVGFVAAL